MRLATVLLEGRATYGVVDGDQFLDIGSIMAPRFPTLRAVLAAGALDQLKRVPPNTPRHPLAVAILLPPIPDPGKILCVGLNYDDHRVETGRDQTAVPTLFTRFADTLTGHEAKLLRPSVSDKFDYEGELAIIIGRSSFRVSPEAGMQAIAGYACFNDASVRDFQSHTTQFTPGKNFRATGGFGPWMVTRDAFGKVGPQRIETLLNGVVVQQAVLADMVFDLGEIVAYCSRFTPLSPGDVIATGTPAGVGARRTPPVWLQPGDRVEVKIESIGTLCNVVLAE